MSIFSDEVFVKFQVSFPCEIIENVENEFLAYKKSIVKSTHDDNENSENASYVAFLQSYSKSVIIIVSI